MKDYFIRLLRYDRYANLRILAALLQTDENAKAEQLMAHLLIAQQVWLGRCIGKPDNVTTLWPDWKANAFEQIINDNHHQWLTYLESARNGDFEQLIYYKNLQGDNFETKLSDILTHLINHGTHHRAQAGQHLKLAEMDLPGTDYILFAREH